MKAWIVHDTDYYSGYSIIVFAETRNKAIVKALGEEEFEDFEYTELRAKRFPDADGMYKENKDRLDFEDPEDCRFLIKLGYTCNEDYYDPDNCEICAGNDICEYRKSRLEESE